MIEAVYDEITAVFILQGTTVRFNSTGRARGSGEQLIFKLEGGTFIGLNSNFKIRGVTSL